jgi:hypothetical protein
MHAALGENIGHRMPNQLADAQLTLRAAGSGTFFLVMARHVAFSKIARDGRAYPGHPRLHFG